MSRDEAARYIGVSSTKFDEMVASRRMPRPKRVDGRVIWDRIALDIAFADLPDDSGNRVDEILSRARPAA
jgi:predicted DNA-binding transcriptional regulator AlpA